MRRFLRRLFTWKALVRLLFVIVLLATLLLVFITEENWRGRRAWAAYRSAAEARGEKLFFKDFIPADIPDEENYAATPFIRELFAKMPDGKEPADPFAELSRILPSIASVSEEKTTDFAKWQETAVEYKWIAEKSVEPARDVLRALEKVEPVLEQLREASSRPGCKFQAERSDGGLPNLRPIIRLIRMGSTFAVRTDALLSLGDSAAAYREYRHVMRMYEALAAEPSIVMGMLRSLLLGIVFPVVRDGLAWDRWTDAELRAIEKDFAGLNMLDDFQFAMSSDRGLINQMFLQIGRAGPDEKSKMGLFFSPNSRGTASKKILSRMFWTVYPNGWVFQSMVKANEYHDLVLRPYRSGTKTNPVTFIPKRGSVTQWLDSIGAHSGPKRLHYILVETFLPSDYAEKEYLANHTMVQQTRLACAMERFRRAKGAFPSELGELVPEFIPAVPVDVCDGNPLRYRRNADGGYDLWSIGTDRKDDGGKPEKSDSHSSPVHLPDFVWHMPGRP